MIKHKRKGAFRDIIAQQSAALADTPAPELVKPAPQQHSEKTTHHLPAYSKVRAGEVMSFECVKTSDERQEVYFSSIIGSEAYGDSLMVLVCSYTVITIKGTGLENLRKRLRRREVEFIYESGKGSNQEGEENIIIEHISFDDPPGME